MQHTEGPWHIDPKAAEESYFEDVNILQNDGLAVAVAVHNGNITPPVAEANARLMAAAPELLEAAALLEAADEFHANCEECGGDMEPERCPVCIPLFDDARVKRRLAIAKAIGPGGVLKIQSPQPGRPGDELAEPPF